MAAVHNVGYETSPSHFADLKRAKRLFETYYSSTKFLCFLSKALEDMEEGNNNKTKTRSKRRFAQVALQE